MPSHGLPKCALTTARTASASNTTGRRCTNRFVTENTSFRLEPEVLQRLGGAPVERRGTPLVSALRREISLGDPRGGTVRRRRQLGEGVVRLGEGDIRLVEPVLLQQRAPE